jgi:hypothetical protein
MVCSLFVVVDVVLSNMFAGERWDKRKTSLKFEYLSDNSVLSYSIKLFLNKC